VSALVTPRFWHEALWRSNARPPVSGNEALWTAPYSGRIPALGIYLLINDSEVNHYSGTRKIHGKSMQIITLIILLLVLTMLSAPNAQAQQCGAGFNSVKVSDSEGKSIGGVIIKLVAQVPEKEYEKLRLGTRNKVVVKIPVDDAEKIIKDLPIWYWRKDNCGNPLTQYANETRVRTNNRITKYTKPSIKHFGFCTRETATTPFLLKVSAPGYLTNYYMGIYLGGCESIFEFVLTEEK